VIPWLSTQRYRKDYAVIQGHVYYDRNKNETRDDGETGIAGVTVTLNQGEVNPTPTAYEIQHTGTVMAFSPLSTQTDANGYYFFRVYEDGAYIVTETDPVNYLSTTPNDVPVEAVVGEIQVVDFGDVYDGPDILVAPTSLDFGSVLVGSNSAGKTVTITNIGTKDLTLHTLTINEDCFTISNGKPADDTTLTPDQSITITLLFSPSATGVQSGALTVSSDDPDEGTLNVSLTGSGYESGPGPGPGPGPEPTPTPTTTTTTTTTTETPVRYFTVDYLGRITREIADEEGRPVKNIEAYSPDGLHLLEIPAGTSATGSDGEPVTLIKIRETNSPELPENTVIIGQAYSFTPTGTTFDKTIRLTLGYNVNDLPEGIVTIGTAYYSTELEDWVYLDTQSGTVAGLGRVSSRVNHFTVFAILAETEPPQENTPEVIIPEKTLEPASFVMENLSISLSVPPDFQRVQLHGTDRKELPTSRWRSGMTGN
jgi:hypothetical protein